METSDRYFKLSKCKKITERRRTLCGTTARYHVYFEPKGLNKHERRVAIDSFKHPSNKDDRRTSHDMVIYAAGEFLQQHDINEFDVILGVPSSSGVVKKIIDIFILDAGFTGHVSYKGFAKTRIRNIRLKQSVIDSESSLKTKEKVPEAFHHTRRLHYDKVSKASLFPTRFRRYFENFLQLNVSNQSCLLGKKILVVDDTFGEGLTFCECFRILQPYTNDVLGFSVMKDIAQNRKK